MIVKHYKLSGTSIVEMIREAINDAEFCREAITILWPESISAEVLPSLMTDMCGVAEAEIVDRQDTNEMEVDYDGDDDHKDADVPAAAVIESPVNWIQIMKDLKFSDADITRYAALPTRKVSPTQ